MVVWLEFNPTILTLDLGPACQLFSCFLTKQPYTNRALLRFNFCEFILCRQNDNCNLNVNRFYRPVKCTEAIDAMAEPTEREKMLRGELYRAFTPDLIAARTKCKWACKRFNDSEEVSRRRQVELWRE